MKSGIKYALEHEESEEDKEIDKEQIDALELAIVDVKTLDKINKDKENDDSWIPVKKKLPQIGQRVLVSYTQEDKAKVDITYYDRHGFLIGIVEAWMPLPETYKGEENDV